MSAGAKLKDSQVNSILIVAGENSGEKYGADLIHSYLQVDQTAHFFGIGGREMAKAGAEIIYPVEELNIIGIGEAVSKYYRIKKMMLNLAQEAGRRNARAAVLIDSPDFNLRLARQLKKQGIPVLYYISPTVWAWRYGRLKAIRRYVNRMLLIFPFEKKIYDAQKIPSVYVGHPLKQRIQVKLSRDDFRQKYNLPTAEPLLCLLPGSRPAEIRRHLPILMKSIEIIEKRVKANFVLVKAGTVAPHLIQSFLPRRPNVVLLDESNDKYEAMNSADLILAACGTANMEACLLGIPFIAFYRVSPLLYKLGKGLVRTKNYSIVNILAGKPVVPELIQNHFTPERVAAEAFGLLTSSERRNTMSQEFGRINRLLGEERASFKAAQELHKLILENREIDREGE